MTERDLFIAALQLDPAERPGLFERECGDNPGLRQRVEALLAAHDKAGSAFGLAEGTIAYEASTGPGEIPGTLIDGRYKLLERIGEGGMGSVWVAEQVEPIRRKVALKLIKPGMDSRSVLARFEAERQALAMMDHPNIAKVLDAGLTDNGRPYFVMEYVKGVPITEYCDAARLSIPDRLQLFVQVCQAVQHAHLKGIIHRDLKPSNILVAPYDDRPVPKVIDFGLAKAVRQPLTEQTVYTAHEMVLGTPLYMSPEQAQLNNLDVDTRSDVYSLGVLLYELLTGTTPLERQRLKEAAWEELRRLIREEEPPRPSTRLSSTDQLPSLAASRHLEPAGLTRMVRGDLDWIVMKSLEKDRARRYETANGFAADVQRYLSGEAVLAAPPSPAYKFRKFIRRRRRGLLTTGLASLAVLGVFFGIAYAMREKARQQEAIAMLRESELQRDMATRTRLEAEAARDAERSAKLEVENARAAVARLNYAKTIDLAHRAWRESNVARARDLLDFCPPNLRGWEWQYVRRLGLSERLTIPGRFRFASLSRDASRVIGVTDDGAVQVWDTRTGKLLSTLAGDHSGIIDEGKLLNLVNGRPNGKIDRAIYSPDNDRIIATGKTAQVWNARTGELLRHFEEAEGRDSFSPDGLRIYACAVGQPALGWDAKTDAPISSLPRGFASLFESPPLAFSLDNSRMATTFKEVVHIWDAKNGNLLSTLRGHVNLIHSIAFSPNGTLVVTTGWDSSPRVYDTKSGKELFALRGSAGSRVPIATFSPDGAQILTASNDSTARLWDAKTGAELHILRGHTGPLSAASFSADGSTILTAGADGIRLWDARAGEPGLSVLHLNGPKSLVALPAPDRARIFPSYSPDGSKFVQAAEGNLAEIIEAQTGAVLLRLKGHSGPIQWAAFSPDGLRIVTRSADSTVRISDARTGREDVILKGIQLVNSPRLSFSPDGSRLLGLGPGGPTQWSATTGAELLVCKGHTRPACSAQYSPDGSRIVSTGEDAMMRVWNAATGQEQLLLRAHVGPVMIATFSPDGSRIVSGGYDQTVRIWDAGTGAELITLAGPEHPLVWTAFSADGNRVLALDRGNTLRIWEGDNRK